MMFVSSLQTLSDQIVAHNLPEHSAKPKWAFSARGERNHIFRWSLTLILAIAYLVRLIYFETDGYFLLTLFLALYLASYAFGYYDSEFSKQDLVEASDHHFLPYHKGDSEPAVIVYFSEELSTPKFDALVLQLLEFKFWYTVTHGILVALLLTWFTLLRLPSVGPNEVLWVYGAAVAIAKLMWLVQKLRQG